MLTHNDKFWFLEDERKEHDFHLRPSDYQTYLSSLGIDLDISKCSSVSPFFLLAHTARFFPEPKNFNFFYSPTFDRFNQKIKMLWLSLNPNILFHSRESNHPSLTVNIYGPDSYVMPIENPGKEISYLQNFDKDKLNQFCDSIKLKEQQRKGCKTYYVACLAQAALTQHLGTDYYVTDFYFGLDSDRCDSSGPLEIKVSENYEKQINDSRAFELRWDLAGSPLAHAYAELTPKSVYDKQLRKT